MSFNKDTDITVRLPPDLMKLVAKDSKETGESKSSIVRQIIRNFYKEVLK